MKYVMWFFASTYLLLLVVALVLRLHVRYQRRGEDMDDPYRFEDLGKYAPFDRVDEAFDSIVRSEAALDDVIEKLATVGVIVPPEQRGVVQRWLDVADQRVPLVSRLALLTGWLETGR